MNRFILLATPLTLIACVSFKIHNKSDHFIDIQVPQKNAWIGCSDTDLNAKNSLMTFYITADNQTHEFMFRRVIPVSNCLRLEKEYHSLIQNANTVRIVGIEPQTKHKRLITKHVPKKFHKDKVINWTFIRFSTSKGCESYFDGDCDPEQYWGGIIPPKKTKIVPSQ